MFEAWRFQGFSNARSDLKQCYLHDGMSKNTILQQDHQGPPKGEDKLKDFDGRGLTIPASVIPFDSSQT